MKKYRSLSLIVDINPEIKVGDVVRIWDGSGLSVVGGYDEDVSIVCKYPDLTGSLEILENIDAKVIQTEVKTYVMVDSGPWCYSQDIVIQIGKAQFRTCSGFVRKVNPEHMTWWSNLPLRVKFFIGEVCGTYVSNISEDVIKEFYQCVKKAKSNV